MTPTLRRPFAVAAFFWLVASTASHAQEVTVTPPAEVAALMTACTPVDATGPGVRDTMVERGWSTFPDDEKLEAVRTLAAAHLWSILPNHLQSERVERLDAVTDAVRRAVDGDNASLLRHGEQITVILWNGDNLSCVWAGPQSEAIDRLALHIGGFPDSDGVMTAALDQTVEAGGRDWARRMSVARTPVADLPAAVSPRAITDAARLDRAPS